jgi:hypothetical protein
MSRSSINLFATPRFVAPECRADSDGDPSLPWSLVYELKMADTPCMTYVGRTDMAPSSRDVHASIQPRLQAHLQGIEDARRGAGTPDAPTKIAYRFFALRPPGNLIVTVLAVVPAAEAARYEDMFIRVMNTRTPHGLNMRFELDALASVKKEERASTAADMLLREQSRRADLELHYGLAPAAPELPPPPPLLLLPAPADDIAMAEPRAKRAKKDSSAVAMDAQTQQLWRYFSDKPPGLVNHDNFMTWLVQHPDEPRRYLSRRGVFETVLRALPRCPAAERYLVMFESSPSRRWNHLRTTPDAFYVRWCARRSEATACWDAHKESLGIHDPETRDSVYRETYAQVLQSFASTSDNDPGFLFVCHATHASGCACGRMRHQQLVGPFATNIKA